MKSLPTKKILVCSIAAGLMAFGSLAFREVPQPEPPKPTNLKILPKNIDHTQLIAIMHDFEQALNYRCGDCHYADPSNPRHIDFASDANPKKNVARHMMKMMMRINKKFFNKKGDFAANYVNAKYEVTCYTCHHGSEHPLKFSDKPQKEHRMPPPPPAPAQ
jgi:hypothetical protein